MAEAGTLKTLHPAVNAELGNNFPVTPRDQKVALTRMLETEPRLGTYFPPARVDITQQRALPRLLPVPELLWGRINTRSFAKEADSQPGTSGPSPLRLLPLLRSVQSVDLHPLYLWV